MCKVCFLSLINSQCPDGHGQTLKESKCFLSQYCVLNVTRDQLKKQPTLLEIAGRVGEGFVEGSS